MKKRLSASVIRAAIDDLPTGLAFADATGRIVLMNRTMAELGGVLTGSYPQLRGELEDALAAAARIEDDPPLYRFPDGRIWRFRTVALDEPAGFTQTTAQEMTELYRGAEQLRRDNEALRRVSRDMKEMYERMSERIRDSETLELKMRIHNNIGASLIALSELFERGGTDAAEQLAVLRDAVGYLTRDDSVLGGTLEKVRRQAERAHVALRFTGDLPREEAVQDLLAAAAQECVTNCVRHAHGESVHVAVTHENGAYLVTITNSGAPPRGAIVEGGGLGSLRARVEAAGGEMHTAHSPAFALTLRLVEGGSL